jgi:hypothetical protein
MRKTVVAIGAAALIAGCGGGHGTSSGSAQCITANGYGGLGGRVNAFDANNNHTSGPAEPTPGAAWYEVTRIDAGCVTAFSVRDSANPPLGTRDMLVRIHPYLPTDAQQIVSRFSCAVWKSAALQHATGLAFAKATAEAQEWVVPGSAQITVTSDASCQ